MNRVIAVDPDEASDTEWEIDHWLRQWKEVAPPSYGPMAGSVDTTTLAYPYGSHPDPIFQRDSWPILTSMRNVDGTCMAQVLNQYEASEVASGETE